MRRLFVVPALLLSVALAIASPAIANAQRIATETTPPSIDVAHNADGLNGWTVSNPTSVTVTATDSGSGLAGPPTCTSDGTPLTVSGSAPDFSTSVAGQGAHTVSCTASDNDGNQASDQVRLKIDSLKPTVNASAPSTPDGDFVFAFSEPVDLDPTTSSVVVLESADATTITGSFSCPLGLNTTGRCATWHFHPDVRLFPGDYYDVGFLPFNGGLTDKAGNAMDAVYPTLRAATAIDNLDPEIVYSWGTRDVAGTYGGNVANEQAPGATSAFAFKGTKLTLYTMKGPDQGLAKVKISDPATPVTTTVNAYAATTSTKVPLVFKGLSTGRHTVRIQVQGVKGDPAGTNSYFSIDAYQVGTKAVVRTPKLASRWSDSEPPFSYSRVAGAQFELRFRGSSVTYYPHFGTDSAFAEVYIDDVLMESTHLDDTTMPNIAPVTFDGLTDAVHTLTIINPGVLDTYSTDTLLKLDRIEIG